MTSPLDKWRVFTLLTRNKAETLARLALVRPEVADMVLGHVRVPGSRCGVCFEKFDYRARITPHAFVVLLSDEMIIGWTVGICRACLEDNGLKACAATAINALTEAMRDDDERAAMRTHGKDAAKIAKDLMEKLMESRNGRRKK